MEIEEVLFRLGILSNSAGYKLLLYALQLLLACKGWNPSLKELQREVNKIHTCTYDMFKQNINHAIKKIWMNRQRRDYLNQISPIALNSRPTVKQFIQILHGHITQDTPNFPAPEAGFSPIIKKEDLS